MLGLLRNNFKNKFKNFYSQCSYKHDKPILGPGFYTFFWCSIFTYLIVNKISLQNYYLHVRIEDLKKEITDLKKKIK
jgi:hypothetical protein